MSLRKLQQKLSKTLEKKASNYRKTPALLGNGEGVVEVPERDNYVYYRIGDIVGVAYSDRVGPENDLPVWISNDPSNPEKVMVLSAISDRPVYGRDSNYNVGDHADQHSYSGRDPVYIQSRQIIPLRITPNGGMSVTVSQGVIKTSDGYAIVETQTLDLSSYEILADLKTRAKYLTIEAGGDGTLAIVEGVEVDYDALAKSDIPSPTSGSVDIGAIRIYSGQTEIYEGKTDIDIFDPRLAVTDTPVNGGGAEFEYIDFNLSPSVSAQQGRVLWNADEETLDVGLSDDVTGQMFREGYFYGKNGTGATVMNGAPVMFADAVGASGKIEFQLAIADGSLLPEFIMGILTEPSDDGEFGNITRVGSVRGIDTTGTPYGETWAQGDVIYVSPTTAGYLTNIEPSAPERRIMMAVVEYLHAVNGSLLVRPTWTPKIEELDNVNGTTPVDGALLVYDEANEYWDAQNTLTQQFNYWNGSFLESHALSVTSDGTTVKATIEQSGGGDLTMRFSDGYTTLDCTPLLELAIDEGTSTTPAINYVYVPKSTKTLTYSTSGWPTEEAIKVGVIIVRTAALVSTEGGLVSRWNDHSGLTSDGVGHSLHIAERLRQFYGEWANGVEATATIVTASSPDDVYIAVTSGEVYQLHKQSFSAVDMQAGGLIHIANHPTTPFVAVSNLNTQLTDALGGSLSGGYFTFVVWGINSSGDQEDFLMLNLPTGEYNNISDALADVDGYSVYDIPQAFKNTGFLIGQFTFSHSPSGGGSWALENYIDLRGKQPNTTAGSSTGSSGITTFLGLTDTPSAYTGEAGKRPSVNSAENAMIFVDALTEAQVATLTGGGNADALHVHGTPKRNLLLNGGFDVDQRNSGAASTVIDGASKKYLADMWFATSTGANVTGQQVTGSGQSTHAYQFTGATGVTAIKFGQRIEKSSSYHANGKTCTLSAVLSNSALTSVSWAAYRATTDNSFGTIGSTTLIDSGTFTVTPTPTIYSTQLDVPTSATHGIEIVFSVAGQTSGTWTIGEAQLVIGEIYTSFDRRPYSEQLFECQRYYAPIGRNFKTSTAWGICFGTRLSSGNSVITVTVPNRFRATPTATLTGTMVLRDGVGQDTSPSLSGVQGFSNRNVDIIISTSLSPDTYNAHQLLFGVSSGIELSADL